MKKTCLLFLFLLLILFPSASKAINTINKTIQVGETIEIKNMAGWASISYWNPAVASIVWNGAKYTITGLAPGYAIIKVGDEDMDTNIAIIKVVGVQQINIPNNVNLSIDEEYTYAPIITDSEANTTLTWTSTNSGAVTVSTSGKITAVGTGIATITCTSTNGVKAQSIVRVSPLLAQSVSLDKKNYEMSIGESLKLISTITPSNSTFPYLKWLSSNENIAQVDDEGNVTAIAPGYCSIFCIADDGSKKYDKCLVHVQGESASRADVNGDGKVSVTDAFSVIDVILNQ